MRDSLRQEYKKYRNVLSQIDSLDQDEYQTLLKSTDSNLEFLSTALSFLMNRLYEHYGKKIMIFIDE